MSQDSLAASQLVTAVIQSVANLVLVIATWLLYFATKKYADDTSALVKQQSRLIELETQPLLRVTREPNQSDSPDLVPVIEITNLGRGHAVDLIVEYAYFSGGREEVLPTRRQAKHSESWAGQGKRLLPLFPDGFKLPLEDCERVQLTLYSSKDGHRSVEVYQTPRMYIFPLTRQSLSASNEASHE